MSDLLQQILAKLPAQTSSVSQLQQVFRAINNSNIQGFIDYKPDTNRQQLTLTLPLVTRSNAATAINIDMKLAQLDLSQLNLKQPLSVVVTPRIEGNRVSFELNLRNADLLSSTNPGLLSQFKTALSSWSSDSTPLVFIKEMPLSSKSTTQNQVISAAVQNLIRNSMFEFLNQPASSKDANKNASVINQVAANLNSNISSKAEASQALLLKITLIDSLKQGVLSESKFTNSKLSNNTLAGSTSSSQGLTLPSIFQASKLSAQQIQVLRQAISTGSFSQSTQGISQQGLSQQGSFQTSALTSLIDQFALIKRIADQISPQTGKNLSQLLQSTLQKIPDATSINAQNLKQVINNSGLFYEQKQAQLLSSEKLNFEQLSKALNDILNSGSKDRSLINTIATLLGSNHANQQTLAAAKTQGDLKHLFSALRLLMMPLSQESASSSAATQIGQSATLAQVFQKLLKPVDRKAIRNIDLTKQQLRMISQLNKDIDGANSSIRQTQAINLLNNDPTSLFVEIPLFYKQQLSNVQLNFEYERQKKDSKSTKWNVTVRFDFPSLGAFHAIIKLQNDFLDVRFVAEKPETQQLLAQSMDELANRLRQTGLNVNALDTSNGQSKPLQPNEKQASGVNFVI
ncbi:MAG: flagellar hook-length control protein FliK [Gammaproteobacteria bacterium]|nr:flagellar hook-length control protein FliK [Gammaproteobacteria bacterium]